MCARSQPQGRLCGTGGCSRRSGPALRGSPGAAPLPVPAEAPARCGRSVPAPLAPPAAPAAPLPILVTAAALGPPAANSGSPGPWPLCPGGRETFPWARAGEERSCRGTAGGERRVPAPRVPAPRVPQSRAGGAAPRADAGLRRGAARPAGGTRGPVPALPLSWVAPRSWLRARRDRDLRRCPARGEQGRVAAVQVALLGGKGTSCSVLVDV